MGHTTSLSVSISTCPWRPKYTAIIHSCCSPQHPTPVSGLKSQQKSFRSTWNKMLLNSPRFPPPELNSSLSRRQLTSQAWIHLGVVLIYWKISKLEISWRWSSRSLNMNKPLNVLVTFDMFIGWVSFVNSVHQAQKAIKPATNRFLAWSSRLLRLVPCWTLHLTSTVSFNS